jgi:hypothetical protein
MGAGNASTAPRTGLGPGRPAGASPALPARDKPQNSRPRGAICLPGVSQRCTFRSRYWTASTVQFPGLHAIRRHQRTHAKWVLALFCLVWIQAAALPCAMAIVPDGMARAAEEHCGYCPPATDTHVDAGAAATCAYPDQPQADARASTTSPLLLAMPVAAYVLEPVAAHRLPVFDASRPPDRSGPTLAVSYCRFLK